MSHTPPIPKASVAPFPAHPEPHVADAAAKADPAAAAPAATPDDKTRRVIAGAAVGIGSAAIVAALLYANRKPARTTPKGYERAM